MIEYQRYLQQNRLGEGPVSEYDIFFSYAREDRRRVRPIIEALKKEGWSVFWDRTIPPGETWRSFIERPLNECAVVVVAWSHYSINSDWVGQEADQAKARNALIPITIDAVNAPFGLRHIQRENLIEWLATKETSLPSRLTGAIKRRLETAKAAAVEPIDATLEWQRAPDSAVQVDMIDPINVSDRKRFAHLASISLGMVGGLLAVTIGGVAWYWLGDRESTTTLRAGIGTRPAGYSEAIANRPFAAEGDGNWVGSYSCANKWGITIDLGIRSGFGATAASSTIYATQISVRVRAKEAYITRQFIGGEATIIGRYSGNTIRAHGDEHFGEEDCTITLNRI